MRFLGTLGGPHLYEWHPSGDRILIIEGPHSGTPDLNKHPEIKTKQELAASVERRSRYQTRGVRGSQVWGVVWGGGFIRF